VGTWQPSGPKCTKFKKICVKIGCNVGSWASDPGQRFATTFAS